MLTNGKYTIWGERIRKPQGLIEYERDQRIFPPYYCSMKFLRVFPEFLEVYRQDYDFFFFNVSFAGKRYYAPYPSQKAFFKELRYKLDCDYLSGIPHKLSLIYLIPDYGMRNPFKSGGAPPILNFTGFLLFQKSVRQSFDKNCVQNETIAFFGSEFDSIKSIESFKNALPFSDVANAAAILAGSFCRNTSARPSSSARLEHSHRRRST